MTTTARERLERIELSDGRILRMGNTCEFMVDESKAPDALGRVVNLAEGFAAIATAFAAAMAPEQAAPVRTPRDQEVHNAIVDLSMEMTGNPKFDKAVNAVLSYIATLEQQSDTSGEQVYVEMLERQVGERTKLIKSLLTGYSKVCKIAGYYSENDPVLEPHRERIKKVRAHFRETVPGDRND